VWLIVKGFSPSAFVSQAPRINTAAEPVMP